MIIDDLCCHEDFYVLLDRILTRATDQFPEKAIVSCHRGCGESSVCADPRDDYGFSFRSRAQKASNYSVILGGFAIRFGLIDLIKARVRVLRVNDFVSLIGCIPNKLVPQR